jgi:hypothetical protein
MCSFRPVVTQHNSIVNFGVPLAEDMLSLSPSAANTAIHLSRQGCPSLSQNRFLKATFPSHAVTCSVSYSAIDASSCVLSVFGKYPARFCLFEFTRDSSVIPGEG